MAYAPKPIKLTSRAAIAGEKAPQPFVVVGDSPSASLTVIGGAKKAAHINNASVPFADLTAAANAYNALLAAMQAAGQMA